MVITERFFRSGMILPVIGGIFYFISYDFPQYLWWLSIISVALFFLSFKGEDGAGVYFKKGFIFGLISLLGILSWYWGSYPAQWTGIDNELFGFVLIFIIWIISSLVLAIFFGFWAFSFKYLSSGKLSDGIVASSSWVTSEYLRSLTLSFFVLGKASLIWPYWTFGFLGYPLVWSKFFSVFAPFGGVYLLSFLGVLAGWLIYFILSGRFPVLSLRAKFLIPAVLILALIFINIVRFPQDHTGSSKTIAIIHTNFPSTFVENLSNISEKKKELETLVKEALNSNPDIIILPEDSRVLRYSGSDFIKEITDNYGKNLLLIDSGPGNDDKVMEGTVSFKEFPSGNETISGKRFLMPFGEYLPYAGAFLARIFGQGAWVDDFNSSRGYSIGRPEMLGSIGADKIGALFCSEIIPEELYRKITEDGAGLLINVSSQSAFRGNFILSNQTLSLAKMKAVSNDRYFAEAGNMAPSFIMSNRGETVSEINRNSSGVVVAPVYFNYSITPSTRLGDWAVYLSAILALISCFFRRRRSISL